MTYPKNSGLLITSTIPSIMFTKWLLLYYVKLIVKYTKNEIGEPQDYRVSCDSNTVTKFIKKNFSPYFYWKIFYLL